MTIEITCGQCQGLIETESGNLMVECPHCGIPQVLSDLAPSINSVETPSPLATQQEQEATIQPVTEPVVSQCSVSQKQGVSGVIFFLLLSYASLVTLAFAYYFWMTSNFNPSVLENLPDVEPKKNKNGTAQSLLIPEEAKMPRGHTLKLGESRRFGDILVTPMKVTRGPLHFVLYDGTTPKNNKRPPSKDVLKLWVRFENVSENISIKPLGRQLTFKRGADSQDISKIRANNFVCQLNEKTKTGHVSLLYDLIIDDVWDLKNQNIDRDLQPGESFETYIPSGEEERLTGELVWRIHFRKGHNKKSLRGVTTLLEVQFSSSNVIQEDPSL
ncbi:hypothetical protein MNBD_PLANCTO02-1787 [hydrothermal vent metagenome]|uniref:Uncharacterized protein n=1 Tax=hydrothermal vent metagenome TaxID=652676 RepID=A0A3B1DWB6_9ZZZZ